MLPSRILVKCGGFSSELRNQLPAGIEIDGHALWASRFDLTHGEAVKATHRRFLECGADIILSNTYQASIEGYQRHLGLSETDSEKLIGDSVRLAQAARADFLAHSHAEPLKNPAPLVFASIGSYGAYLHNASEYKGHYDADIDADHLETWHKRRIRICVDSGVDGLAIETIPCKLEGVALTAHVLANHPAMPFWLSYQCRNASELAHGDNFADAALSVWKLVVESKAHAQFVGVGVNCLQPKDVTPLFISLQQKAKAEGIDPAGIPLVVYSNSGEQYDEQIKEWRQPHDYKPVDIFVPEWLATFKPRVIGGCCRVTPAMITKIRALVDARQTDI